MDQQPNPNIQPEQQPATQPQKPCCKAWPMAAIVAAGFLIVGGLAYGAYYVFIKPQYTCWPYCPSITDQDRENIKNAAGGASSSASVSASPSASSDATADWQTYKNEQYGFEVKYPVDWKTGTGYSGQSINFMPIGGQDALASIFVYNANLSEAEKMLPIFSVPGREVNQRTDVFISGVNWKKLLVDTNQVITMIYYNGSTYIFQYSTLENTSPKILSTFKFTP